MQIPKYAKYIKGNASFERPKLPTLGVGKWPMCTHSAHLAPLTCQVGEIGCCWQSSFSGNTPSL